MQQQVRKIEKFGETSVREKKKKARCTAKARGSRRDKLRVSFVQMAGIKCRCGIEIKRFLLTKQFVFHLDLYLHNLRDAVWIYFPGFGPGPAVSEQINIKDSFWDGLLKLGSIRRSLHKREKAKLPWLRLRAFNVLYALKKKIGGFWSWAESDRCQLWVSLASRKALDTERCASTASVCYRWGM